jgi:hypothetical protein
MKGKITAAPSQKMLENENDSRFPFSVPSNRSPLHCNNFNGGSVCLHPLTEDTALTFLLLVLPAERQEAGII